MILLLMEELVKDLLRFLIEAGLEEMAVLARD
jgi:hypothetical protein